MGESGELAPAAADHHAQGREDESTAADPWSAASDPGDRGADRQRLGSRSSSFVHYPALRFRVRRFRDDRAIQKNSALSFSSVPSAFSRRAHEAAPCSGTAVLLRSCKGVFLIAALPRLCFLHSFWQP